MYVHGNKIFLLKATIKFDESKNQKKKILIN